MHQYLSRKKEDEIKKLLTVFPSVAILGPRQCGKSTLAKHIMASCDNAIYIDLEDPDDFNKLKYPKAFLEENKDKLICLDEIQRVPEFFSILRGHIDTNQRPGQFLVLGSASKQLVQQSSESLAGRIVYTQLSPLLPHEVADNDIKTLWLRGGFPRSYLAGNLGDSGLWRKSFIQTFLERDLPQFGIRIPARQLHRMWRMCAHLHGRVLNKEKLAQSLGVSANTVQHYIDILQDTFMLQIVEPHHENLKKRLVKSPKLYIRDSGILHSLLQLDTMNDLLGHPVYGNSWEGFVVTTLINSLDQWEPTFYRTAKGQEIDLVLQKGRRKVAIEIKASTSPDVEKGFFTSLSDLEITEAYIVAPVKKSYAFREAIKVMTVLDVIEALR